jgi:hypothetical protein
MIVHVHRGKGVVLSPLLWILLADSLQRFSAGFCDDVIILISGKFHSTNCDLMQRALNCKQNYCGEIGLNVNADKTFMVLSTKRRNLEGFYAPKLFDTEPTKQSGKTE